MEGCSYGFAIIIGSTTKGKSFIRNWNWKVQQEDAIEVGRGHQNFKQCVAGHYV